MTIIALLVEARKAGLTLTPKGEKLRIRGPKSAAVLIQEIAARKVEVLAILKGQPDAESTVLSVASPPQDLPSNWHELWDERAAILEYEAGLHRELAEAKALDEITRLMEK
jgi:hypothetical protein